MADPIDYGLLRETARLKASQMFQEIANQDPTGKYWELLLPGCIKNFSDELRDIIITRHPSRMVARVMEDEKRLTESLPGDISHDQ